VAVIESRSRLATLLPGAGLAVLSKFTCAACVAGYSGVLASLGVGFVATDSGLTILTVALLGLGLASVAWSTRRHRNLGPPALVVVGSGVLLTARSGMPSTRVLLAGAAITLAGSVWNLWLERRPSSCCVDVASNRSTQ
jgi:hypothetical protein